MSDTNDPKNSVNENPEQHSTAATEVSAAPQCTKTHHWKRELCVLLLGLVSGATLFAIYSFFMVRAHVVQTCEQYLQKELILTYETELPYNEAILLFEKNAKTLPGWSVSREYCKMPGSITVFKLCHKAYAEKLLNSDNRRKLAAILPCSFAIYPTEDGKTRLVRINAPLVEMAVDSQNTGTFQNRIMPEQDALLKMCGFKQTEQ